MCSINKSLCWHLLEKRCKMLATVITAWHEHIQQACESPKIDAEEGSIGTWTLCGSIYIYKIRLYSSLNAPHTWIGRECGCTIYWTKYNKVVRYNLSSYTKIKGIVRWSLSSDTMSNRSTHTASHLILRVRVLSDGACRLTLWVRGLSDEACHLTLRVKGSLKLVIWH